MASAVLFLVFVASLAGVHVNAQGDNSCVTKTAVCSLKSQIRGTISFGETQGAGCFNNGNLKVTFDLVGFPPAGTSDVKGKDPNGDKKDDVYTFRLKTYGEIMPACSGMGPDFGAGITAGELGVFSPNDKGHIYNDTTYIPRSSSIPDRSSIIGRSVGIYAGPYSNYGNNVVVDCCVIGYGLPRAGTLPTVAPLQSGTGVFGKGGIAVTGANNNLINNNSKNNLNARNTISDDKFQLIGGYGNGGAFGSKNDPQFGYQGTSSQPFRSTNSQGLYGSNPFSASPQGNRGFGNGPSYNNIYNRGNNNFNTNRVPIAGTTTTTNNDNGNYFDGTRGSSANGAGAQGSGSGYSPSSTSFNNGNRGGFSNSQFPSVFSNIGSPDFFNLDGELAGAAFVKGGPEAASGLGLGAQGTGGDSALSSSLSGGFKAPKGPSFQDIYNKPTGESPLSGLGFSDTVAPERRNSISDLFFGDGNIKDTIGLTDEDMFIPRENEESESSSSYQSDSGDSPDETGESYNDNENNYDGDGAYDINQSNVPYDTIENDYSYKDKFGDEASPASNAISSKDGVSPVQAIDLSASSAEDVAKSNGPKPVYRPESDSQ